MTAGGGEQDNVKHEREAQETRFALQRSLENATLGGRKEKECREKRGEELLDGLEMEMQAGW